MNPSMKYCRVCHPSLIMLPCAQVMERMRSTLFCLVLPGDSASARRTSEIFMSGCLPVFLGPPYGAMPLADSIDYRGASLFFNVTDYRSGFRGFRSVSQNPNSHAGPRQTSVEHPPLQAAASLVWSCMPCAHRARPSPCAGRQVMAAACLSRVASLVLMANPDILAGPSVASTSEGAAASYSIRGAPPSSFMRNATLPGRYPCSFV